MFALRLRAVADGSGSYPANQAAELAVMIVAPNLEEARLATSTLLTRKSEWRQLQILQASPAAEPVTLPQPMREHMAQARERGIAVIVFPTIAN